MTEHMAGPFCTMILADMGADVIKLERPGAGDSSRGMGDGSERNPYFRYINRNKKSLTLDYKGARGREIFLKLIPAMDVLVENYRPTVMDRAGLGWETLNRLNPRLIYAQLSGFGSDGPYREKGGFDLIAQGMGGIMHVTGEPDGPPTSVGLPICDLGTGMWGAQGVLAALYERQRTGQGQKVECSLLETAVGFSSWTSAGWLADHVEPVRMGSRHRQNAPYQRFETKDGYMMIGAAGQSIWQRCAARSATRSGSRTLASRAPRSGARTASRSRRRSPRCWPPRRRALDQGARRRGRAVRARSTTTSSSSPTPRCSTARWWSTRTTPSWAACPTSAPRSACPERRGGAADRAQARPAHRRDPGRARLHPGGASRACAARA